ncbi:hypothetical protein GOP47_0012831 [Adiantum capillus-veneris]|uniref:Uncharacterized protein n=1 Tax=Adiantum capillus-veneris TaxID=13818 RepID=A0A9D4URT8_ADICA|nr:hypothetical protein GOP47_0012831 [Adiantum capillus-veneris]
MAWDTLLVVNFVQRFCGTPQTSEAIFANGVIGKLFFYMTSEGWSEIGIKSVSHRHALVDWSKRVLEGGHTVVPKSQTSPLLHSSENMRYPHK